MGTFLTNIQSISNTLAIDQVRQLVIETIRERMHSLWHVEVTEEKNSDRTIFIGPSTSSDWISIYDQGTEQQEITELEAIASILSEAVNGMSVAILVHDSDLLELRLFRHGNPMKMFCNWPDYFADQNNLAQSRAEDGAGHTKAWRDLLLNSSTEQDLRAAWESSSTFEEASKILERMAPLVGWNSEWATVGFDSITERLSLTCKKLYFQKKKSQISYSKPPLLAYEGGVDELKAYVGAPLTLSVVAHNTGRASQGITIVVWGPAFDEGIVDPTTVTLTIGPQEANMVFETSLDLTPSETGQLRLARLTEVMLPQGLASPAAAFKARSGNYKQGINAWLATRVEVSMKTFALREGTADLHIGLVPIGNPEAGQTSWTIELQIRAIDQKENIAMQKKAESTLAVLDDFHSFGSESVFNPRPNGSNRPSRVLSYGSSSVIQPKPSSVLERLGIENKPERTTT